MMSCVWVSPAALMRVASAVPSVLGHLVIGDDHIERLSGLGRIKQLSDGIVGVARCLDRVARGTQLSAQDAPIGLIVVDDQDASAVLVAERGSVPGVGESPLPTSSPIRAT